MSLVSSWGAREVRGAGAGAAISFGTMFFILLKPCFSLRGGDYTHPPSAV